MNFGPGCCLSRSAHLDSLSPAARRIERAIPPYSHHEMCTRAEAETKLYITCVRCCEIYDAGRENLCIGVRICTQSPACLNVTVVVVEGL